MDVLEDGLTHHDDPLPAVNVSGGGQLVYRSSYNLFLLYMIELLRMNDLETSCVFL